MLSYPIVASVEASGQVCLDQQNNHSIAAIRSAVKSLKGGMPLVIYSRGGTNSDGEIKPFLPGPLFLAIKAQVDIRGWRWWYFELLPMIYLPPSATAGNGEWASRSRPRG